MADSKYYWIKLRTDFFADDSPMDILLSQPNGSEYVCLYIKLCLSTANKDGRLCNQFGEMIVPYDIEKIQRDMKHFSIDTVRVALELYQKLGLIYEEADGVLSITNHMDMVGSEGASAQRMRDKRARDRCHNEITMLSQSDIDIRDKDIRDKDIKSKEIEKEKEHKARFVPPTLDEVKDYITEKEYKVNPEQWLSYYQSNGWMVGRNKMKDWRACISQWNARDKKEKPKRSIFDELADA